MFHNPLFYQILATRKPQKHILFTSFKKIITNWLNLVKNPELLAVKKKTAKKKDKKGSWSKEMLSKVPSQANVFWSIL
jgi:hypothetical protein